MAVRDFGNKPIVETEGVKTNPTTSTLMADTGALVAGIYEARVILGASAAASFQVQRRNAANGANVGDVPVIRVPASASGQYQITFELEASERIRVMMNANLTGDGEATLNVEKLA